MAKLPIESHMLNMSKEKKLNKINLVYYQEDRIKR